jgi:protein gp37
MLPRAETQCGCTTYAIVCVEEQVAFFFKQWGGRTAKAGGRLLDDRTYDAMPARDAAAI